MNERQAALKREYSSLGDNIEKMIKINDQRVREFDFQFNQKLDELYA